MAENRVAVFGAFFHYRDRDQGFRSSLNAVHLDADIFNKAMVRVQSDGRLLGVHNQLIRTWENPLGYPGNVTSFRASKRISILLFQNPSLAGSCPILNQSNPHRIIIGSQFKRDQFADSVFPAHNFICQAFDQRHGY